MTESVTEKIPPVLWQQSAGKGEKARQELTAREAIREAGKTPCGARQNRGRAVGPLKTLGYRRITANENSSDSWRNPGETNDHPQQFASKVPGQNSAYRHRNMEGAFENEGALLI